MRFARSAKPSTSTDLGGYYLRELRDERWSALSARQQRSERGHVHFVSVESADERILLVGKREGDSILAFAHGLVDEDDCCR